jgi:L-seryl-tRNA(Ser) seleniumtransferase
MLAASRDEIQARAKKLISKLALDENEPLQAELIEGESAVGGGSGPNARPATVLIALSHRFMSAEALEQTLRTFQPPIIARVANDRVLIDLRTVLPKDEAKLTEALQAIRLQPADAQPDLA